MLLKCIVLFLALISTGFAQTGLTPAQIAYLNQLFATAKENSMPGPWLIDGSVTIGKLVPSLQTLITAPEADPYFIASPASSITVLDKSAWNAAYSWGNHATEGYLKSYSESDPVYSMSYASTGTLFSGVITSAYWKGAAWGTNLTYYVSGLVASNVVSP